MSSPSRNGDRAVAGRGRRRRGGAGAPGRGRAWRAPLALRRIGERRLHVLAERQQLGGQRLQPTNLRFCRPWRQDRASQPVDERLAQRPLERLVLGPYRVRRAGQAAALLHHNLGREQVRCVGTVQRIGQHADHPCTLRCTSRCARRCLRCAARTARARGCCERGSGASCSGGRAGGNAGSPPARRPGTRSRPWPPALACDGGVPVNGTGRAISGRTVVPVGGGSTSERVSKIGRSVHEKSGLYRAHARAAAGSLSGRDGRSASHRWAGAPAAA